MGSKEQKSLDAMIAETDSALKRLETLQKGSDRGLGQRLSAHVRRHSGNIINVLLAGSVFAVAIARLNEKYSNQAQREELETVIKNLQAQKEAATARLDAADRLAAEVEEASGLSSRLISAKLKEALENFKRGSEGSSTAAAAAAEASSPSGGAAAGSSGKLMI